MLKQIYFVVVFVFHWILCAEKMRFNLKEKDNCQTCIEVRLYFGSITSSANSKYIFLPSIWNVRHVNFRFSKCELNRMTISAGEQLAYKRNRSEWNRWETQNKIKNINRIHSIQTLNYHIRFVIANDNFFLVPSSFSITENGHNLFYNWLFLVHVFVLIPLICIFFALLLFRLWFKMYNKFAIYHAIIRNFMICMQFFRVCGRLE